MDNIQEIIEKIIAKIKGDPSLVAKFKEDPTRTIEGISGIDIPEGAADGIIEKVKEALAGIDEKAASGFIAKIKGLFRK